MNRQDVQCFIFSWPKVKDLAVGLYDQLAEVVDTVVIDSGDGLPVDNCDSIVENAYFTEQVNSMLDWKRFSLGKQIAYTFVADTKLPDGNYADLIDTALKNYDAMGWAMYCLEKPGVRMFGRTEGVHEIPEYYPADLGHCLMHRKLIDVMPLEWDVGLTKYGWGIDILYSNKARAKGWPVVRDFDFPIDHLEGRGYDRRQASLQMNATLEHYAPWLKEDLDRGE